MNELEIRDLIIQGRKNTKHLIFDKFVEKHELYKYFEENEFKSVADGCIQFMDDHKLKVNELYDILQKYDMNVFHHEIVFYIVRQWI